MSRPVHSLPGTHRANRRGLLHCPGAHLTHISPLPPATNASFRKKYLPQPIHTSILENPRNNSRGFYYGGGGGNRTLAQVSPCGPTNGGTNQNALISFTRV